jgi:hypothetical protein
MEAALSPRQQAHSRAILKEWIRSVLRETAIWAIRAQLVVGDKVAQVRFGEGSLAVVQRRCHNLADAWASQLAARGLTVAAETIRNVAAEGSDNLYVECYNHGAAATAKPRTGIAAAGAGDSLSTSRRTTPASSSIATAAATITVDNPVQRWNMLKSLQRDTAEETLDLLLVSGHADDDDRRHFTTLMLDRQKAAARHGAAADPAAAATSSVVVDREKLILVRKRKSRSLKMRSVHGGIKQRLGRPKEMARLGDYDDRYHDDDGTLRSRRRRPNVPRPPLDPEAAFQGALLSPVEQQEIDRTMFHPEQQHHDATAGRHGTMPPPSPQQRLIGAVVEHTTRELPRRLHGPVVLLEAYDDIYILRPGLVQLQWRNDPMAREPPEDEEEDYHHHLTGMAKQQSRFLAGPAVGTTNTAAANVDDNEDDDYDGTQDI